MKSFREFLFKEGKDPNFCYMIYPESPFKEQLLALQQSLHIQAEEMVDPDEFHCTVRYVKLIGEQNPDKFVQWLSVQQLPVIEAFTQDFSMFREGSLVMELDTPQMHEWFNKVNSWMTTIGGYAPSEFPTFKPHISLAYGTTTPTPVFDVRRHRLNVKFTIHKVTNQNKEVIFEKRVQNYKGTQFGLTS